ncbi:hypothetical protein BASA60_009829 [Batrachochytrium salamandrivorans]|nr:hypothetical protein BASA60_009829 [Batrachochytrium salamandrivorans]
MSCSLSLLTFSDLSLASRKLPLTCVSPDTPIATALQTLAANSIINLPVSSHNNPDKAYAVINILDLVSYMTRKRSGSFSDLSPASSPTSVSDSALFLSDPVELVLSLDPDDESYMVFEKDLHDTVHETLEAFTTGLHRALITDITGKEKPLSVATIAKSKPTTDCSTCVDTAAASTPAPSYMSGAVVCTTTQQTAQQAFAHLVKHGVRAAPIVDAHGAVIAVISVKDLRRLTGDTLASLSKPVVEFLKDHASNGLDPLLVNKPTTLLESINLLLKNHMHHLWLVDAENRPTGVVSHSDIIAALIGVE